MNVVPKSALFTPSTIGSSRARIFLTRASSCRTKPSRNAPSSQYEHCSSGQPVPSGPSAGAVDRRALPGVVVDGVVLVEVPGDALAGRHGPIAEPARRLDAAQRKRQEGRLDLRLAGACVVGRRRSGCGRGRKAGLSNQRAEASSRKPELPGRQQVRCRGWVRHSTDHRLSPSKGGKSRWDARRAANIWIVHWAQAGRKSLARFFTGPQSRYGDWSIFRPSGVAPANESLAENMGLSPLAARGGQSHVWAPGANHGYAPYRQNEKWCILSHEFGRHPAPFPQRRNR